MIIKVTQQHIDKGYQGYSEECPIALALKEATGLNASVYEKIFLRKGKEEYLYDAPTPQHVVDRIKNYDKNNTMTPFQFEIDYENQSNTE